MGTICPCGVEVNAFAKNQIVHINDFQGKMKGNLLYKADACITTLEKATISLKFESTSISNFFCLSFTSNAITNVTCRREGQNCIVTVTGTGKAGYKQFPFTVEFIDQNASSSSYDIVQSFVIKGLFEQFEPIQVKQGSIIALGCQSV